MIGLPTLKLLVSLKFNFKFACVLHTQKERTLSCGPDCNAMLPRSMASKDSHVVKIV